jgi:hypothetical protein
MNESVDLFFLCLFSDAFLTALVVKRRIRNGMVMMNTNLG